MPWCPILHQLQRNTIPITQFNIPINNRYCMCTIALWVYWAPILFPKIPGPCTSPLKQPQNIHPRFLWCFSTIQVGSHSSPALLVTQVLVCLPSVIHVSFVPRIEYHCSCVQFTCSRAHFSWITRFRLVIEGFLITSRWWKPSFIKPARTAFFPTPKSSSIAHQLASKPQTNFRDHLPWASCSYESRLFRDDMHTYSMRSSICAWVRTGGRPDRLVGVAGVVHAYCIWRHEKPVFSWICAYFHPTDQRSWQSRRWSRVKSDFIAARGIFVDLDVEKVFTKTFSTLPVLDCSQATTMPNLSLTPC